MESRFDIRYKVAIIGDHKVGKSSLLRSINNEVFNQYTKTTIGACDVMLAFFACLFFHLRRIHLLSSKTIECTTFLFFGFRSRCCRQSFWNRWSSRKAANLVREVGELLTTTHTPHLSLQATSFTGSIAFWRHTFTFVFRDTTGQERFHSIVRNFYRETKVSQYKYLLKKLLG